MTPDGTLKWNAPAGLWEVLRIGYTTTGAQNGPATKAGTGLECDKMDTAALNLHFRSFPAKLIRMPGNMQEILLSTFLLIAGNAGTRTGPGILHRNLRNAGIIA